MPNNESHSHKLLKDKVAASFEKQKISAKEEERHRKEVDTIVALYNEIASKDPK